MSTKTLEQFFTGKNLTVPSYQRDYAWTERNVDELFDDVEEAIEVGGRHYLGTFILSQTPNQNSINVVDGQQRLTTLTMLLDVLIDAVTAPDLKQHYRNIFITNPVTGPKFRVSGQNKEFFARLLDEDAPPSVSDGQERLRKAHEWIRARVNALLQKGGQEQVKRWLQCISELDVLELIEANEGKAIRMFQSVNDRGVPLSKIDIVKSLLVYNSNRYLDARLDEFVAQRFGDAYRSFGRAKRLAREKGYEVRNINRDAFREDDVLRYHYFAFDGAEFDAIAGADYSATSEKVLEQFLKPTLKKLRTDPPRLESFIRKYTEDLAGFFEGLETLLSKARTDRATYLLLVAQDLSATLYPLVIRLQLKGWLHKCPGAEGGKTLQDVIEVADLRVFKLRGTNPQADIAKLTRDLPDLEPSGIAERLRDFCKHFMSDALLASRLVEDDLYRNPGVQRMLLEIDEHFRAALGQAPLKIEQLVAANAIGLTAEHILPQEPNFHVAAYGFSDADEYSQCKHKLGNLIALEATINSACSNRTVEEKMSAPNLYLASGFTSVKALAAQYAGHTAFNKASLEQRAKDFAGLIAKRWPID